MNLNNCCQGLVLCRPFIENSFSAICPSWTRLGYTYDWGNPDSDVGLSEFIIIGGSTVGVHSITANDDYFSYHLKITHFIAKNTSMGLFTPQATA